MTSPIEIYLSKIEADLRGGKATEYTYRSSLEALLEAFGKGIEASNDPKHVACGAPDFIVELRKVPLGYVETKDLGVDLDKVEKSDQMKRYLKALNNLILTDYLEFRWYVNGERKLKVQIAEVGKNNRLVVDTKAEDIIAQLLSDFFATEAPTVGTPKELAERLAGVTHFIRDQIIAALESGDPELQKALEQQYKTFVELLLPALTHAEFADLYAQAITYGLFAAKLTAPEGVPFTFEDAYKYLRGNPFLRRLFLDVNEQLDEIDIIRPYLEDLVSLLNRADFHSILKDFGRRIRTEDPVVHFYETFLATYDPKLRESRGVYYTPEPVVQFIVNSVDELLRTRFGKAWGLADESVKVLDPATGTGTFLYYVIRKIHEEVVGKRNQSGLWKSKSKEMLKRIFGFELLIAPYVVSHLKLGLLMQTLGAPLEGHDERLHVYMTNTLEEEVTRAETLAGLGLNIAQESIDAARVKKLTDINVVLGNPPYSNFGGLNKGKWIIELIDDYKKGLNEKKINLDDDYIKFIRFGQWRINRSGQGILAFITNNSFIDGITHRQMRKSLMETFADIYILNLHGSSKKQEESPDGSPDQNVFDIQQGVSINIFIKIPNNLQETKIRYSEIWGSRENKYDFLLNHSLNSIEWFDVNIIPKHYFFVPKDFIGSEEYEEYASITKVFPEHNTGIQTKRDSLVYQFTLKDVEKVLDDIERLNDDDLIKKYDLPPDGRDWTIQTTRQDVANKNGEFTKVLYHPFDNRWTYYTGKTKGFMAYPRYILMKNALQKNLLFLTIRNSWRGNTDNFYVSESIVDKDGVSPFDNVTFFPLYVYTSPEETKGTLFALTETERRANISAEIIQEFSHKLAMRFVDNSKPMDGQFGPEDIFYYAYAIFHSPMYRKRYAELLKIDFPRLPLTSNKVLFSSLAGLGKELVDLHLLKSPNVDEFITSYPVVGDNWVQKIQFMLDPKTSGRLEGYLGRVNINLTQYFGDIPEDVWNFKIGGYQVCEKWLKDRKGRTLSGEDISHYQRVVVALKETIRLMQEIDEAIPGWPMA